MKISWIGTKNSQIDPINHQQWDPNLRPCQLVNPRSYVSSQCIKNIETSWIGTKKSQICHRNNTMSTLTTEIGLSVTNIKISPCFGVEEEEEVGGLGRRKQIQRGSGRWLREDKAASTIGPGPGKQTPAISSTARLEEEEEDEQQHPCAGETEEEQPT